VGFKLILLSMSEDWSWIWWSSLLAVSVVNFGWYAVAVRNQQKGDISTADKSYYTVMRRAALPFILVCAYRGWFPTIYLSRSVLIDSGFSSILLARGLASVAEVCWVFQIASALSRVNSDLALQLQLTAPPSLESSSRRCMCCCRGDRVVQMVSVLLVLLICAAECFSCTATVTTDSLYFMLEEGSWVVGFTMVLPCSIYLVLQLRKLKTRGVAVPRRVQIFCILLMVCMIVYVPWGWTMDVPANYRRWQNDTVHHKQYNTFKKGLEQAANFRVPTRSWDVWKGYLLWMTGYFTAGVWSSILLVSAPCIPQEAQTQYDLIFGG